jgi:hypothetical protein
VFEFIGVTQSFLLSVTEVAKLCSKLAGKAVDSREFLADSELLAQSVLKFYSSGLCGCR